MIVILFSGRIGMADPGEPFYGEIAGVVFCAEEAVLQPGILSTILDWKDRDLFCAEGTKRVVACAPITEKVNEEKGMGWMPLLNNGELNHIQKHVYTSMLPLLHFLF